MLPILQYRRNYPVFLFLCFIATIVACAFLSPMQALASSVIVDDQASVLDASKVQAQATQLPYAILIYTTNTFNGDQDALNQATRDRLPDQESLVIGIDVAQHHLSIESGTNIAVSDSQASDAVDAFRSNFNNGDYTGATIAAINSLKSGGSDSSNAGGIVLAIVIVLIVLVTVIIVVARRRGGNNWRGPRGGSRYGGIYEGALIGESIHHHHHHTGSSFGGGSFGGGAGGSFGGGGGGSFGGGGGGSF